MIPNFDELAKNWKGGPYVHRSKVAVFSGGMLHPRTMANLDCLGQGPNYVKFGKRVFYPVEELVVWMKNRASEDC